LPRSVLEQHWSLDEMLGPDYGAEVGSALAEYKGILARAEAKGETISIPLAQGRLRDLVVRIRDLTEEYSAIRRGFGFVWQVFAFRPTEGYAYRGDPPRPRFKVYLFPSLRAWLTPIVWALRDSIEKGREVVRKALDELHGAIERLATFAARSAALAVLRSISAVRQALAVLRRRHPIATGCESRGPTLRDLVGELLSLRVLAAGGGLGQFVIRI
jgi:hypothetical protein